MANAEQAYNDARTAWKKSLDEVKEAAARTTEEATPQPARVSPGLLRTQAQAGAAAAQARSVRGTFGGSSMALQALQAGTKDRVPKEHLEVAKKILAVDERMRKALERALEQERAFT